MMRALLLVLIAACGQNRIEAPRPASDAGHDALITAIDAFVGAGSTPAAYGELARAVAALRRGASTTVAREAELRLVVLALGPMRALRDSSRADQRDALALTVWPTLLATPIDGDTPDALAPNRGEDPDHYVRRLCDGPLAAACPRGGAEVQAATVHALAIHRASRRAHDAIDRCLACTSDPDWHAAALAWEELDRDAEQRLANDRARRTRAYSGRQLL